MFKCWRARFVLLPLNVEPTKMEPTKRLLEMIDVKKFQSDEHQLSDDELGEAYSESSDDEQDESDSDSAESDLHDKVLPYHLSLITYHYQVVNTLLPLTLLCISVHFIGIM